MPNSSAPARPARPWLNKRSTALGMVLVLVLIGGSSWWLNRGAAAHKEEVVKIAEERDEAKKAREEMMTLPRIRPVMVAPPPILQPVTPNP